MSNSHLTVHNAPLPPAPARAQQVRQQGQSLNRAFQDGVQDSFPVMSIKGSRFSFRFQGNTHPYLDQRGIPIGYCDVVLAAASPFLGRTFYAKGFTEGDISAPDCWSNDGVRPEAGVPQQQSPTCVSCRQNIFGSKVTPAGKQVKACATSRRIALILPHELTAPQMQLGAMLLRVPYSSLGNLKEYASFLDRNGYEVNACVTRLTFTIGESFPKLKFAFERPLDDHEYDRVLGLATDDRTLRILSAPQDGAEEPADEALQAGLPQAAPPPPPFVAPAPVAPVPVPPIPSERPPASPPAAFSPPPSVGQPNFVPPIPAPSNGHGGAIQAPPPAVFAPAKVEVHPISLSDLNQSPAPSPARVTIPPGAPAPAPAAPRRRRAAAAPEAPAPAPAPAPTPPVKAPAAAPAPAGLDSILAAMLPQQPR
jgi:hypothetical protein